MLDDRSKSQRANAGEARPVRGESRAPDAPAPISRASLEEAIAWIDAHSARFESEEIVLDEACGRVIAVDIQSPEAIPPFDRAAVDGYALCAAETVGASDYNPLKFALCDQGDALPAAAATPIVTGAPLPLGADAILPLHMAQANGTELEVFGPVPQGWGIEKRGQQVPAGASLVEAGRVLLPQHIGLLASAGIRQIQVVQKPRVRLLVFPPKPPAANANTPDANSPMLRALIERDGGTVFETEHLDAASHDALSEALTRSLTSDQADLVLIAGRSGHGVDDFALPMIADQAELAIHGVALRPGGTTSMALVRGAPLLLLPGDPLDCWSGYEMLAGRWIRRIAGGSPELPYVRRQAEVEHKIVSAIGVVDVCRVRRVQPGMERWRIEPVGPAESGGLTSAARADGFVLVPAPLEGFAPGARVEVFLFVDGTRSDKQL